MGKLGIRPSPMPNCPSSIDKGPKDSRIMILYANKNRRVRLVWITKDADARKMFTVGLVKYRRCKHQDQGLRIKKSVLMPSESMQLG